MSYHALDADSTDCGGRPTHLEPVDILLPRHVAPSITLQVISTLQQAANDESFGITDVEIIPFMTSGGIGVGKYRRGYGKAFIEFTVDDNIEPWVGSNMKSDTCEKALVASSPDGESIISARFTSMPAHNAMEVNLMFGFMQPAGQATVSHVHLRLRNTHRYAYLPGTAADWQLHI